MSAWCAECGGDRHVWRPNPEGPGYTMLPCPRCNADDDGFDHEEENSELQTDHA